MLFFPNAKINIGLNVVEKRTDGFHNIETILYPIGLSDCLEFVEIKDDNFNKNFSFENSGIIINGSINKNLCIKAYHLLANDFTLPKLNIHLHKIIPIGAGLGGGSSDAAFMLKSLNTVFKLGLSSNKLKEYARQLGSDCSFFIDNKPAFAYEKGDKLMPIELNLKDYLFVLICPDININTAKAYLNIACSKPQYCLKELLKKPIEEWKKYIYNNFEESIFANYPEIKEIKEKLYGLGAIYASMSGSGSSVYGIFSKSVDLRKNFSNYFVWQGELMIDDFPTFRKFKKILP